MTDAGKEAAVDLKPCPFCGTVCHNVAWPRLTASGLTVAIIECFTDGCYARIEADTPSKAEAAWNRRAASGNDKLAGYAGVKDAEVNKSLPTQGGGAGDRETLRQALVYARYHVELSPASDKAEALAKIDAALQAAPSEGGEPVAWRFRHADQKDVYWAYVEQEPGPLLRRAEYIIEPLYARPPAPSEEPLVGCRDDLDVRAYDMAHELFQPHEWGYRCPVEGSFIEDRRPFDAAEMIRALLTRRPAPAPDAIRGGE